MNKFDNYIEELKKYGDQINYFKKAFSPSIHPQAMQDKYVLLLNLFDNALKIVAWKIRENQSVDLNSPLINLTQKLSTLKNVALDDYNGLYYVMGEILQDSQMLDELINEIVTTKYKDNYTKEKVEQYSSDSYLTPFVNEKNTDEQFLRLLNQAAVQFNQTLTTPLERLCLPTYFKYDGSLSEVVRSEGQTSSALLKFIKEDFNRGFTDEGKIFAVQLGRAEVLKQMMKQIVQTSYLKKQNGQTLPRYIESLYQAVQKQGLNQHNLMTIVLSNSEIFKEMCEFTVQGVVEEYQKDKTQLLSEVHLQQMMNYLETLPYQSYINRYDLNRGYTPEQQIEKENEQSSFSR